MVGMVNGIGNQVVKGRELDNSFCLVSNEILAMDTCDEIRLVSEFKKGNDKAFKELFEMFFPKINGFSQKFLGKGNAAAEDISIETLNKLFKRCLDFDSIVSIRAFLYVTARNACFDHLRYSDRQESLGQQWGNTVDGESSIEIRQIEGEMFNAVKNAVEKLPSRCRQIIQMIYLDELSTAEISARLKISVTTVRSQKRNGINLLKAVFADKQMILPCLLLLTFNFGFIGLDKKQISY